MIDLPIESDKIVSQIDILPTLLDLMGEGHYLPQLYGNSALKGGDGLFTVSSSYCTSISSLKVISEVLSIVFITAKKFRLLNVEIIMELIFVDILRVELVRLIWRRTPYRLFHQIRPLLIRHRRLTSYQR